MAFRVAETLGEQWQEAMGGVPLAAHFAQRQPHAAGCEVGAAGRFDHHEAAQLDDEGEAVGTGDRIPAEPCVAVLEPHGRPAPAEHRDKLLKTALRVAFVNALPEDVTCGPAGVE